MLDLDQEHIDYIFREFSSLMTRTESAALKHHVYSGKSILQNSTEDVLRNFEERGWLTRDPKALDLLKDGFDVFKRNTAIRIFNEHPRRVFFNKCPICHQLARTKVAKQCRCGHGWHHLFVGEFRIDYMFSLQKRGLCIAGEAVSGNISIGMRADLTVIGLTIRPIITDFGYVLHRALKKEDLGLTLLNVPEFEQDYLKKVVPVQTPIPIML